MALGKKTTLKISRLKKREKVSHSDRSEGQPQARREVYLDLLDDLYQIESNAV